MGKRQIRIFRKNIAQHLPELRMQESVQVILRNRVVVQGKLNAASEAEFELLDGRRGKHVIPVQDVEEVIYDIEAPY
jgi:glutamate dehydrogenase/leucine dehydrogenase